MDGIALSPQQRQRWLAHPGPGLATLRVRVPVAGPVDSDLLCKAFGDVARRHDILRSSFEFLPGMKVPVQVVQEEPQVTWKEHDLTGLSQAEREDRLAALEAALPATIDAPVLRAVLARLAAQEHVLLLALPALWADRRSIHLLCHELVAAYRARLGGGPHAAADEPMQYWQYAAWLAEILGEEDAEEGRRYWRGIAPAERWPTLPFDAPSTDGSEPRGVHVPLAEADGAALNDAARREGVAIEALVLACWQAILGRFTGETGLEVGCLFDGREFEELDAVLGPFAHVLPVRCPASPGDPVLEVGRRLEAILDEHYEWQRFFEDPAPAGGGPYRLPYLFESEPAPGGPHAARREGDVELGASALLGDPDSFDLKLRVEGGGHPRLTLLHDAGRIHREDAELLASCLATALADVSQRPRTALADLALVDAARRRELLALAVGPTEEEPGERCAHERFWKRVEEAPSALAVALGDTRWTYAEVGYRVTGLAHRLKDFGGPEGRIGLALDASPDAVVAILAILQTGSAYVPIDPFGPVERNRFMLRDSGSLAVVTRRELAPRLDGFEGEVIFVDEPGEGEPPATAELAETDPRNLAYVIYTSGSTGEPKGVAVEHRQLVHYLEYVDRHLLGERFDGCPLVSALTFDASLKQVFVPLLRGTAVYGVGGATVPEPGRLLAELGGTGRTVFNGTPTLWRILLEEVEEGRAPAERLPRAVLLGGERLTPELLERSFTAVEGLEAWNLYGPTEATANAVVGRLERGAPVTIGRPRPDLAAYALDHRLEPVPTWTPGELYLGGAGLARGYVGRPAETAESFLPDPFAPAPGGRLYRTGDRVRQRRDGELEFLGRTDHQVKLRGYRIELGEIEAVLEAQPGVREAVVVVHDGEGEQARLAAYLTGQRVDPEELRHALREVLPDYMTPSSVVVLDDLPRLASGKVDRRSLASLATAPGARRPYVAPRNEIEGLFAEIWSEVLGRARVGVDDDFFELGGHSIQSIRIVHRIREAGYELGPRDLLQNPTVARLAQVAAATARAPEPAEGVEYEEGSV